MIDTDRMKAAFAATPLCRATWTRKDGDTPTKLCAISALVSFAGVQPDLIHAMQATEDESVWVPAGAGFTVMGVPRWVSDFALPVLRAEYGVPRSVGIVFPSIFDQQENEWKGVTEVLALCERHNMDEMHAEAIIEDAARFPLHGPFEAPAFSHSAYLNGDGWVEISGFAMELSAPTKIPKVLPPKQKPGQSKFWTAKRPKWLTSKVGV